MPVILNSEKHAKHFVDEVVKSDSTVREWFKSIIEKIRSILKKAYDALKREKSWEQMEVVRTRQESVDIIAELYFDALESTRGKSAEGDAGGIKFSPRLSPDFASKVDIESNYKSVASMQPVAQIKGTEFAKGDTDLVTQVSNFFESIGGEAVNPELGTIKLTESGIKSDIAHGIGRNKAAAFAAVPAVIEHGKIVDVQYNWKGRGYDTVVIVAPVTLAGQDALEGVIVKKRVKDDTFYLHEIAIEGASTFKTGGGINAGDASADAPSLINILHKISNYKQSTDNVKQSFKNPAEQNAISRKEAQFDVIQNSNAAQDDYHTWIRSADEIKTLEETLADPEWSEYLEYDPDYTRQMAESAIESGKITVYSSDKIGNGVFVTPSRMEAESYSSNGKVYSKTVNVNDIAWIDPTQGQYAPIDSTAGSSTNPDILFSRKDGTPATAKDVQQLQKRNDSLKKQLAIAKQEIKLSGGHMIKPTVIDRLASSLSKEYSSSIDKADLAAQITELYNYIGDGSNVSADDMQAAAMNVAYNILDKSSERDNTKYEAGEPVRKYLKDTTIKLNDGQIKSVEYFLGLMQNSFKKTNEYFLRFRSY